MASRLTVGSRGALITSVVFWLLFGVGLALNKRSIDFGYILALWAFFGIASLILVFRVWQHRKNPHMVKRYASTYATGFLPRKWQLWMHSERDPK